METHDALDTHGPNMKEAWTSPFPTYRNSA